MYSSYASVDPAPALPSDPTTGDVDQVKKILLDTTRPLFVRYQAMFSLRNIGTTPAVLALMEGFDDDSALFRHEIAYVAGQMQHPAAVPRLADVLGNTREEAMVRHECAEALGSIAENEDDHSSTPGVANESPKLVYDILKRFAEDDDMVVRESCLVALDMYEHETSGNFQYANGLEQSTAAQR